MKHVICPVCGDICVRNGKNKSGSQRWLCKSCDLTFTQKIESSSWQLKMFLDWLFGKGTQKEMPGEGRSFRRKTSQFWNLWPLPPKIDGKRDVLYVDGIYLGRKACILICCDDEHVLGWYLCKYEHSGGMEGANVEDSITLGCGIRRWIKRYTTTRPNTPAGVELYMLAKDLFTIKSKDNAENWVDRFIAWTKKYNRFLSQMTYDEGGNGRPTHERLLKAQKSIMRLLREGTMFTYLDENLLDELEKIPSTNNRIEGGVNAGLREMLRNHRGLSIERRIKAVFWWCYMHSPEPLPASEILKVMPTDKSIADIYARMNRREKLEKSLSCWGDAVVWEELHRSTKYPFYWD
jgi:hypothetical protein